MVLKAITGPDVGGAAHSLQEKPGMARQYNVPLPMSEQVWVNPRAQRSAPLRLQRVAGAATQPTCP